MRRIGQPLKAGNYSRYDDKQKSALAYAEKLTRTPHDIADADFSTLKKHFSEPEMVDLHMLARLANLTNRLPDPPGLELEFPEEKI
jgi:alkylhydroperoxidase family enzyme